METGGGFGGKEEYPSMIAGHAALLAWKSGRPVKMIYERDEDMACTTKRHPSRTRHRTAISSDGRLLAMDIDFIIDGGAYCTLSPVVLSRGTIHAAGPYACPNVRVRGTAVATNAPPHGAFRGFGAPQSLFALERHMDIVAAAAGLTPEEFRRRNFIRAGDTLAVGQTIKEPVNMGALLDRALDLSGYHEKRARFARENPGRAVKKGIGFATFFHGAGFTGSGEVHLASVVAVEGTAEGTGPRARGEHRDRPGHQHDLFADCRRRARHRSRRRRDRAARYRGRSRQRTDRRLAHLHGRRQARRVRSGRHPPDARGRRVPDGGLHARRVPDRLPPLRRNIRLARARRASTSRRRDCVWDDDKYRGDAYGTYAWAVYVAEVSVDTATWETRVDDFVALQEVGKVINPDARRPDRSRAASRRASAGRSTRTSSGATAAWSTRR